MLHIAIRLLMIIYFVLCAGDVITTMGALATGAAREGNPVVAWVMRALDTKWLLVRLAMSLFVIFGVIHFLDGTRWAVAAFFFANLLMLVVVGSNWNLWQKSRGTAL
jgi:hypothetical protein